LVALLCFLSLLRRNLNMPASTNRVGLAFVLESVYGVTPSGPPTLTTIRHTGESLKQVTSVSRSAEIREDRQIPDVVRTQVGADGDINFEYFAGAPMDLFTKFAMQSPTLVAQTVTASITCSIVASSGTVTASTGTPFSGFAAGEWVKMAGFATAANNGYFRIASIGGSGLSMVLDQSSQLTDETSVAGIVVTQGAYYTNGTNQPSMTIEKTFGDLTNKFEVLTGMVINGMSFTVPADGMVTGALSFLGKQSASGSSTVGDGSNTAASTTSVMNGVDSPVIFYENDTALSFIGFNFALSNNLRQRQNAGDAFAASIGAGSLSITGSFQAYFEDEAAVDRYTAGTASNLAIVLTDSSGNVRVIDLPQVRFTSAQRVAGGQNQDVIMEIGFEAYVHPTLGHTIRMAAF
jgi:hypothetical protein